MPWGVAFFQTPGARPARMLRSALRPGLQNVIQLSVNGEPRRLAANANVSELLASLELAGKRVAVERNGEIVPRSRYAQTALADGDRLEIVVAVGGG
jgi:sulfur carrier protein